MIFSLVACSGGGDKAAPAQSSSQSENMAQSAVPEVKTESATAETEKNKTEETSSHVFHNIYTFLFIIFMMNFLSPSQNPCLTARANLKVHIHVRIITIFAVNAIILPL